jgi:hypothetical protein
MAEFQFKDRGDFQKMVDAQIEETLGWRPDRLRRRLP